MTKRELKNMLRPLHREVGEDEIARIIEKADVNRDGVISFLEFQNAALAGVFQDVELRRPSQVSPPESKEIRKESSQKLSGTPKPEQDMKPQVEQKTRGQAAEKYLNDQYVARPNKDDFVQRNIAKYTSTKAKEAAPVEKEESEEELTQPLIQLYDLDVNDLEHLKAQFRAVDSDNNGVLTERELKLFLKRLKVKVTDAQVSKMMQ